MANMLNLIIRDIGEVLSEMEHGNYAVESKEKEKYGNDFQQVVVSMRGLRDQMTKTLRSIGEASDQVSSGSMSLADAAQSLAEAGGRRRGIAGYDYRYYRDNGTERAKRRGILQPGTKLCG